MAVDPSSIVVVAWQVGNKMHGPIIRLLGITFRTSRVVSMTRHRSDGCCMNPPSKGVVGCTAARCHMELPSGLARVNRRTKSAAHRYSSTGCFEDAERPVLDMECDSPW